MGIGNMISKLLGKENEEVNSKKPEDLGMKDEFQIENQPENVFMVKTFDITDDDIKASTEKIKSEDNELQIPDSTSTDEVETIELTEEVEVNSQPSENVSQESDSNPTELNEQKILEALGEVYDPEIPIDIVNMGLIYGVDIQDGIVKVTMTMTSPGCPSSGEIVSEAKMLIEEIPGVKEAILDIVWDPPWDPSKMSEDAQQSMGM